NFMNICRPYFDQSLAIDLSWKEHNVSGRDIVVGVTDVGINTDNVYLRENIQLDLSYNFVDNNSNTIPTILPGIIGSLHVTNHGNACAGLIARPKTNALCNPCGLGVAYKAKGRNGLGSVYVFPAGHPGSGLVNYVGSIPVACMDVNGSVADVSQVNAATIVSVFCNGRRRIDDRMITVGHDDRRCFTEFGGESAGTAIVSGMIALLLEANQNKSADWYVLDFCDTSPCIEKMEEVLFQMKFVYSELHHMRLWAKSPSGTVSELASIEPRLKGSKITIVK
ncbi:hypothetical protein MAR_029776, partial [Mya arenaria]